MTNNFHPFPEDEQDAPDFNPWTISKLAFVIFLLALLVATMTGCTRRVLVTYTRPHVIHRVDTIGHHIRLHVKPVGKPRSSLPNGHRPGDTIQVLKDYFFRY